MEKNKTKQKQIIIFSTNIQALQRKTHQHMQNRIETQEQVEKLLKNHFYPLNELYRSYRYRTDLYRYYFENRDSIGDISVKNQ